MALVPANNFSVSEALELSQHILEDHGGGSLRFMHERSLRGLISSLDLSKANVGARECAIDFLTDCFHKFYLRDEWLASVVALLDRIAVASAQKSRTASEISKSVVNLKSPLAINGPAAGSKDNFLAEWLATTLCILKLSTSEAELDESMKETILKFVQPNDRLRLWKHIYQAESHILLLLNYHVALPTAHDIALRIALEVCSAARRAEAVCDELQWAGLSEEILQAPPGVRRVHVRVPMHRFTWLVTFLVEIAMAHLHMKVYRDSSPPAVLALAALYLSLQSFGEIPQRCINALASAERAVFQMEDINRQLSFMMNSIHSLWKNPPQKSMVMTKWNDRNRCEFKSPLPKAPEQLWLPPMQERKDTGAVQRGGVCEKVAWKYE